VRPIGIGDSGENRVRRIALACLLEQWQVSGVEPGSCVVARIVGPPVGHAAGVGHAGGLAELVVREHSVQQARALNPFDEAEAVVGAMSSH